MLRSLDRFGAGKTCCAST